MLSAIRQLQASDGMVTDIDRRQCSRRVPMKILILGLPRTGTASLKFALEMLGYFNVYHGEDAFFLNPRDCEMWNDAFEAKYHGKGQKFSRKEFDQLLGHCQAVSDLPAICFAPELIEAYPEAKVILTDRSIDGWQNSVKQHDAYFSSLFERVLEALNKALFMNDRQALPLYRKVWWELFRGELPTRGRQCYEEHCRTITGLVAKDRLLRWNPKEGWGPLCKFLDQPLPEVAFPHVNDGRSLAAGIQASHKLLFMRCAKKLIQSVACVTLIWTLWNASFRWKPTV